MKPVAVNPNISFTQLVDEIATVKDSTAVAEIIDQILAKLQRKRSHLSDDSREGIEAIAGMPIQELVNHLRQTDPLQLQEWFRERAAIAQILDLRDGGTQPVLISHHQDELRSVERGYGNAERPEDYLDSFKAYLQDNLNKIPALIVVTQRPHDLTRAQLKELRLLLSAAGYSEKMLQVAWRDMTNEDIAASIIGFIRQAALGDALMSYEQRVDRAIAKILASRAWTTPQRRWLERIGKQLKAETIVDRDALDKGEFRTQGGGFVRLNKAFDGRLEDVLVEINDALWQEAS
jgi:type I restriction enzyme R subunit